MGVDLPHHMAGWVDPCHDVAGVDAAARLLARNPGDVGARSGHDWRSRRCRHGCRREASPMGDKDDPADDQTDCKHGRDLSDRHEGSAARYRAKPRRDPGH